MIIVTGSSKGIGNYIANALAYRGLDVVGISRTMPAKESPFFYETLVGNIPGQSFKTYIGDVTKREDLFKIQNELKTNNVVVDALINCAGVGLEPELEFRKIRERNINEIIQTNIIGTINSCQYFMDLMDPKKHTPIINMSSLSAHAVTDLTVYAASKGGIYSFTKALAQKISHTQIRPNCISPGIIDTDMINGILPERKEAALNLQVIKRMFTKEDIYNVVELLLDKRSNSLAGQAFYIGGS